jgi:copper chaperone CopZ
VNWCLLHFCLLNSLIIAAVDVSYLIQLLRLSGYGSYEAGKPRTYSTSSLPTVDDEKFELLAKIQPEELAIVRQSSDDSVDSFVKGSLAISGMTCVNCVNTITNAVKAMPGVKNISIALLLQNGVVEYDPSVVTLEQIIEEIDDIGFEAFVIQETSSVVGDSNNDGFGTHVNQKAKRGNGQREGIHRLRGRVPHPILETYLRRL